MFPTIYNISDVLPHIEGDKAFKVGVKEDTGHTFIDYNHMGLDVFPPIEGDGEARLRAQMRRECRGIAFDTATGALVSRPFHKFFNVGERAETAIENLPWHQEHVIMDKLDGSMIRPLRVGDGFRWGTKMGVTDVAEVAESFIHKHDKYEKFAAFCEALGVTPIFEFVSPRNRIVVNYGEDNLILLAMRGNLKGFYTSRESLVHYASQFDIPVVRVYASGTTGDAARYIEEVRASSLLDEGVVIAWPDSFAKSKTEIYSKLHAVKDEMATERRVINVILDDRIDDALPILSDSDRDGVLAYVESFWQTVEGLANRIEHDYGMIRYAYVTKKDFALSRWAQNNPEMRPIMFGLWDGKFANARDAVMHVIMTGLSSETKWKETKGRFGIGTVWNEVEDPE